MHKKKFLSICMALIRCFSLAPGTHIKAYAQDDDIIVFSDEYLKFSLLDNYPPIDTNSDSEISKTELAAPTGSLDLSGNFIRDLLGIE